MRDKDGNTFARYDYDAYGNIRAEDIFATVLITEELAQRIATLQPLRYAGYAWDSEIGLYYCSQRYYDPTIGAFISKDPIKADGELSAYAYCAGDPIGRIDPSGLIFRSIGNWFSRTFNPTPAVKDHMIRVHHFHDIRDHMAVSGSGSARTGGGTGSGGGTSSSSHNGTSAARFTTARRNPTRGSTQFFVRATICNNCGFSTGGNSVDWRRVGGGVVEAGLAAAAIVVFTGMIAASIGAAPLVLTTAVLVGVTGIGYSMVRGYSGTQEIIKGFNNGQSPFSDITYKGNEDGFRKTERVVDTVTLITGAAMTNPKNSIDTLMFGIEILDYGNKHLR